MAHSERPKTIQFADFDADEFLRGFWQKKPLLIRNPWTHWSNPLEPDELAGLACEDHVESRLIVQDDGEFSLEHGPLTPQRFDSLGPGNADDAGKSGTSWTLLVQAADHHSAEVAELLEAFRFIPNWRVDDVMVSFAVTGGGVGAHFDQYDVFLVQGLGARRWQVGGLCDDNDALLPNDDLQLLADFDPDEDWVLEPGDMLYVPPGFSHKGTALSDDCMTYSVGFRAPSREELIEGFAAQAADQLKENDRYRDPDLRKASNPGEIDAAAVSRAFEMMAERLNDRPSFARWFAANATQPKNAQIEWQPETAITAEEAAQHLHSGGAILRNPASRFAYIREDSGALILSVDGQCYEPGAQCDDFIEALCCAPRLADTSTFAKLPKVADLIAVLQGLGSIALERDGGD